MKNINRIPLQASKRVRIRAKKLTAIWQDDDCWIVTGGELSHIVIVVDHLDPATYQCDCGKQTQINYRARGGICSHALAIFYEM